MGDITSMQPIYHTEHVREPQKPTHEQPSHPKCIPKTQKHAPSAYQLVTER